MVEEKLEAVWDFMVIGFAFLALIGFSLIEAGVSRTIHGPVILVKNLLQISIGITLFWVFGYGFSMGDADGGFIGHENFAGEDFSGTSHYTKCAMFGLFGMLAVFTINGSIMERAQFWVYIWMSTVVMVWIYPVMVAWNWGGGWLTEFDIPVIDQGGAGPIHILGGITGLFGTALLLPRIGRFEPKEQVAHLFEKSLKIKVKPTDFDWGYPFLATVGAMFVWLGLSFVNAALAPTMVQAGQALLNSLVSGSVGSFVALLLRSSITKKMFSYFSAITFGMISGVVSVSCCAQSIEPYEALVIGALGSLLYHTFSVVFRRNEVDDPNEAVSSQFVCGIWSFIATCFVDRRHGVLHGGSGEIFGTQILGLASFLVWATFFGIIIFSPCSLCEKLKINENLQLIGLSSAKITGRGFVLSEQSQVNNENQIEFDEFSEEVDDDDSDS